MGRVILAAAALVVLGAGLTSPWPTEAAPLVGGSIGVLVYLARTWPRNRPPPDDGEGL